MTQSFLNIQLVNIKSLDEEVFFLCTCIYLVITLYLIIKCGYDPKEIWTVSRDKKTQPVQKRISIILSLKIYPLKQWKHSDKLHKLQSLHFSIFAWFFPRSVLKMVAQTNSLLVAWLTHVHWPRWHSKSWAASHLVFWQSAAAWHVSAHV